MSKVKRVDFRLSEIDKNILERAVSYTGESISTFVLKNALKSAQEVISKYQDDLSLSKRDQKMFYDLILDPPSPNTYLAQSAKDYIKQESSLEIQKEDA